MFRVIAWIEDENDILDSACLVGYANTNTPIENYLHLSRSWIVDFNNETRSVSNIDEFPVDSIPSYYAHSGLMACDFVCPDFIEDYITSHVDMDEINKEEVIVYRENPIARLKRKVIKKDE